MLLLIWPLWLVFFLILVRVGDLLCAGYASAVLRALLVVFDFNVTFSLGESAI